MLNENFEKKFSSSRFADEMEPTNHSRTFRHVVQRPINLTYQIVPYAAKHLRDLNHFIPSELDLLQIDQHNSRREKKSTTETDWKGDDKNKTCVILEFFVTQRYLCDSCAS